MSIKRNQNTGDGSGGTQSLPDGTWMMVNQPIASAMAGKEGRPLP